MISRKMNENMNHDE